MWCVPVLHVAEDCREQAGYDSSNHALQMVHLRVLISPFESHVIMIFINHLFEEEPFQRFSVLDMVRLPSLERQ